MEIIRMCLLSYNKIHSNLDKSLQIVWKTSIKLKIIVYNKEQSWIKNYNFFKIIVNFNGFNNAILRLIVSTFGKLFLYEKFSSWVVALNLNQTLNVKYILLQSSFYYQMETHAWFHIIDSRCVWPFPFNSNYVSFFWCKIIAHDIIDLVSANIFPKLPTNETS